MRSKISPHYFYFQHYYAFSNVGVYRIESISFNEFGDILWNKNSFYTAVELCRFLFPHQDQTALNFDFIKAQKYAKISISINKLDCGGGAFSIYLGKRQIKPQPFQWNMCLDLTRENNEQIKKTTQNARSLILLILYNVWRHWRWLIETHTASHWMPLRWIWKSELMIESYVTETYII